MPLTSGIIDLYFFKSKHLHTVCGLHTIYSQMELLSCTPEKVNVGIIFSYMFMGIV